MSLVLSGGGAHEASNNSRLAISAMTSSKPRLSINMAMNATLRENRSSLTTSNVALRLLASAHSGGELRLVAALAAFHLDKFCDLFAMVAYEIAPHGLALRLDA
jgi:hypothetical protein